MRKGIQQGWYYRLSYTDNSFSVYLNEILLGTIHKPAAAQWPVIVKIDGKLYYFTKVRSFNTVIQIVDEASGEIAAVIKMPLLSPLFPRIHMYQAAGTKVTWVVKIFFSLHWQWRKGKDIMVEGIDNLARKSSGVIAMPVHTSETGLLIITGFFLSLFRQSRLSMGVMGLKNKRIRL